MRALLVALVPCLCRLGASTAGPGLLDQGSLLQKDTKLADGTKLADDAHGSLLLPAFARQIPGMEGMMEEANITMQDIMGILQQVLLSLKDPEWVDLLNNTLKDGMVVADEWITAALKRITELTADGKNLTSEEEAFDLLTAFYKKEETEASQLATVFLDKFKAIKEGCPKNLSAAFDDLSSKADLGGKVDVKNFSLDAMVKDGLKGLFEGVTTCTNVTLCKALRPSLANLTFADNMLNDKLLPMLPQVKSMLPSIGPMVGMMVPEVADTVTDILNYTIEHGEPILTSFGEAFHTEVRTVTKIATVHSHCSFGSGSVRSGPGLLLLAVALAAWASLRA